MSRRKKFDMAFQVITEGDKARISDELKRKLFGEDWVREMRAIQAEADDWINTRPVQGLAVGTRRKKGERTGSS